MLGEMHTKYIAESSLGDAIAKKPVEELTGQTPINKTFLYDTSIYIRGTAVLFGFSWLKAMVLGEKCCITPHPKKKKKKTE